jgi:hypothetical protein
MRKNQRSEKRCFTVVAKTLEVSAGVYGSSDSIRITARGWHKETPKSERLTIELQLSLEQLMQLRDEISHELDAHSKSLVEMLSKREPAIMVAYSNART